MFNEIMELNWTQLGVDLRDSADTAHDGDTPDVRLAYQFLLDNPECFSDSDEWPADMPAEPNIELIAGYYLRTGGENELHSSTHNRMAG